MFYEAKWISHRHEETIGRNWILPEIQRNAGLLFKQNNKL
jgi:hypothetical protein